GERSFEKLKRAAVELALEELSRLSEREKLVVKAVAHGCRSWAQVRSFIAEEAGVVLPKATLSRIVEKLEKLSILKDYEFLDAVYREASKRLSPAAKP
ncbi:MAG: ATP-binding protein, partial [Desulfurococcaceae archaeon]